LKRNSLFVEKYRNLKMLSALVTHLNVGLWVEMLFIFKVEKSPNTARNNFSFKYRVLINKSSIYLRAYAKAKGAIIKLT
jgi:hypothetical protein